MRNLINKINKDGYIVIKNVINKNEIREYTDLLETTYNELKKNKQHIYPGGVGKTERLIQNLHNKNKNFINLVTHNKVLPIIEHCLKLGSYNENEDYILSQFSARDPHYGTDEQQLHIDSRLPGSSFPLSMIAMWMLNDFNEDTGATRLVPGSHLIPKYPENGKSYSNEIQVDAPAGSVLIYNTSVWHGGGKKLKDKIRWGIVCTYNRWFLKQSMDMTKNMPDEIYQKLNDEEKKLFGFTTVPPYDENIRVRSKLDCKDLPNSI